MPSAEPRFRPRWEGQKCSLGWHLAKEIQDDLDIELTKEQVLRLVDLYELDPSSGRRIIRRAALRRPKGAGKSPEGGYVGYAELVLPVRFARWSKGGQPVGMTILEAQAAAHRPATGPWVQFAAVSEDQTDNVMVWLFERLAEREQARSRHGIDLGRSRIYLHGRAGRIEPVTAAAGSREGQPITFAVLDQTEAWFKRNGGKRLADTLRRNAGKNDGWTYELQNAPQPGDGSVADETSRARKAPGVLYDTREPPEVQDLTDRQALLDALTIAYGESAQWVDLDRLADEIQDPATDPADARRYYLNQPALDEARAFDPQRWKALASDHTPADGALVTLGFDGAKFHDATALIGCEVESGHLFTIGVWARQPTDHDDWEVDVDDVDSTLAEAMQRWKVWRLYADPPYWEEQVDRWIARWGKRRVVSWWTSRTRPMAFAIRAFHTAIAEGSISHDGDERLAEHIGNARRRDTGVKDEDGRYMWVIQKENPKSALKIDAAMAACLAWEARGDAIQARANRRARSAGFSM